MDCRTRSEASGSGIHADMNVDIKRNGSPAAAELSGGDRDSADVIEHPELMDSKGRVNGEDKTENARKPTNAKDPSRPRRKKARRACFACQRAHLTCGTQS